MLKINRDILKFEYMDLMPGAPPVETQFRLMPPAYLEEIWDIVDDFLFETENFIFDTLTDYKKFSFQRALFCQYLAQSAHRKNMDTNSIKACYEKMKRTFKANVGKSSVDHTWNKMKYVYGKEYVWTDKAIVESLTDSIQP